VPSAFFPPWNSVVNLPFVWFKGLKRAYFFREASWAAPFILEFTSDRRERTVSALEIASM